ncbi:MAG: GAF domain-containing protein [Bacteroidales bacterium]|nr:GAF domain-containing protein [Bacteroidales bacterium]MBN2817806.1 GAF domain-containing protein [Bacteroidales bacterium]
MQIEKSKRNIIFLFIAKAILITSLLIVFWDSGSKEQGLAPFIIYLFIILLLGYTINEIIKAINSYKQQSEQALKDAVSAERIKLIKEFEEKSEEANSTSNDEKNEEIIKSIIPKGAYKNVDSFAKKALSNLAYQMEFIQGVVYLKDKKKDLYNFSSGFALTNKEEIKSFKSGENLGGQTAVSKDISYITDIPEDYFEAESGLGKSRPKNLIFAPVIVDDEVIAIFELSSFKDITDSSKKLIKIVFNELSDKMKLLIQS